MTKGFKTLKADSLKDLFIKEIEAKIISGHIKPGDRLPPERELASQMGISRGIVNSGMLELASRGFIEIKPRKGNFVVDYKNEGTSQVLNSIMNYNQGRLDLELFLDMIDTRLLLEVESARRAAVNRTQEDLNHLYRLLKAYEAQKTGDSEEKAELNYNIHHRITIASGNRVFAMIFKSFEPVCKNLIRMYFETGEIRPQSVEQHKNLYQAILKNKPDEAAKRMEEILLRGKVELIRLNRQTGE